MPRYFFHMREPDEFIEDPEGVDLPSADDARREAMEAAREILAERVRRGETIDSQEFVICDETGRELLTVPFRSAMRLE